MAPLCLHLPETQLRARGLHDDPKNLGYTTWVDHTTGRARTVPFPSVENAIRHKECFGELPPNTMDALESTTSREGKDALEEVIDEVTGTKALNETDDGEQVEG